LKISIVVPALDEAASIAETLAPMQPMRASGHEVIVVDGGSSDNTVACASPLADRVVGAARGRARQMNAGAAQATGKVLWFVHADTRLPPAAAERVASALAAGRSWGRFDVRLSGRASLLRAVERAMNWRSRLSGICTGDQAMFVRRDVFQAAGGFPDIALMEDIALSKRLKRYSRPACVPAAVTTSSRRWERQGVLCTILRMWALRLGYFLGVSPSRLLRLYPTVPGPTAGGP
jgi:rSAM/selenodomain-associated transferase 2